MSDFAIFESAFGGFLIGLAAVCLLLLKGRVLGVSGILFSILNNPTSQSWRMTFLIATVLSLIIYSNFFEGVDISLNEEWWLILTAGLLVGAGTRIGNGCTSGHGVCGMARFSTRSIVATITFILVAMITVYIKKTLAS